MKRILVATDGSRGAERAIDYAARWAKIENADLLIVNVVGGFDLPDRVLSRSINAEHARLEDLLEAESTQMLSKARERARKAGVTTIDIESRVGDVAQTIIDVAQEKKADAIVVGKRGAGRIKGLLVGSVSQKLTSFSPLPVIVVP